MPKIIREYTFEGPEEWLEFLMSKSLPDGEQSFMTIGDKMITVKTIYNDLRKNANGKDS